MQIVKLLEDKVFKAWFDYSLPLSLCSDDDDTVVSPNCVRSNLCLHMAGAASAISSETTGKMYVYYGPSLTGKSTAGKQLIRALRAQKGHNYPSLFVDTDRGEGDLYAAFRQKLAVPEGMTNDVWLSLLFSHLANEVDHSQTNNTNSWTSWLQGWLQGCTGSLQQSVYKNEEGVLHPVIVIDQLGLLDATTYKRLKRLCQLAYKKRVLLYVLTDEIQTANLIAGMNDDRRVVPLPNRFRRPGAYQTQIVYPFGRQETGIRIATGITWTREEWTQAKQHEYLVLYFPNEAKSQRNLSPGGFFHFLVAGENPTQALHRAKNHFGTARQEILQI